MTEEQRKIIAGGLLHDIGKVLYRGDDGRNHSVSGYEFLKIPRPCWVRKKHQLSHGRNHPFPPPKILRRVKIMSCLYITENGAHIRVPGEYSVIDCQKFAQVLIFCKSVVH